MRLIFKPRNWLYETKTQELRRRVTALEEHIKASDAILADLEDRITHRMLIAVEHATRGDGEPEADVDPMTHSLPLVRLDEMYRREGPLVNPYRAMTDDELVMGVPPTAEHYRKARDETQK